LIYAEYCICSASSGVELAANDDEPDLEAADWAATIADAMARMNLGPQLTEEADAVMADLTAGSAADKEDAVEDSEMHAPGIDDVIVVNA
jgi:hypothetical protein